MTELTACLREQLRAVRPAGGRVVGLGISLHGPVDASRGVMLLSEHLGWTEVPFADELRRALGVPVFAEAETRAIALAEQCWGAARGARDFVLIELDAGIGMVQVLDGRLCRGSHSLAGELGFTAWETEAGSGGGRVRVLEEMVSLEALCGRLEALEGRIDPEGPAGPLCWPGEAYRRGDPDARKVLEEAARVIGLAVANVINLLDPELVLLAGRMVSGEEGSLIDPIRTRVQAHLIGAQSRVPRIEPAVLGADAALLGAVRPVIDHFLSVENLAVSRPGA
jgi:glucokinase